MYGDDLAFDVVIWATDEFGLEGSLYITKYGPREQSFLPLRKWARKILGMEPRQYQSLKVRDLVAAIEAKRWPD